MQNWWIAAMEVNGLWTKEQAEHVSQEIRHHIHKESYPEAVEELVAVLEIKDLHAQPTIHRLQEEINELKSQIEELKAIIDTKLAPKKK
jgi:polyhydroxyalkanoate synthesis regulator phasin